MFDILDGIRAATGPDFVVGVRLSLERFAGKLHAPADVRRALDGGADFVLLGRVAIAHHDDPARWQTDAGWRPAEFPLPSRHYEAEGVSPTFLAYLRRSFARMITE